MFWLYSIIMLCACQKSSWLKGVIMERADGSNGYNRNNHLRQRVGDVENAHIFASALSR